MNPVTYYLKAETEADLYASLAAAGMWGDAGDGMGERFIPPTRGDALDVVGVIRKETGATVIVDGIETPATEPVPGWHANLILHGEFHDALAALLISTPAHPARVWA